MCLNIVFDVSGWLPRTTVCVWMLGRVTAISLHYFGRSAPDHLRQTPIDWSIQLAHIAQAHPGELSDIARRQELFWRHVARSEHAQRDSIRAG